jgi:hypothetical protein
MWGNRLDGWLGVSLSIKACILYSGVNSGAPDIPFFNPILMLMDEELLMQSTWSSSVVRLAIFHLNFFDMSEFAIISIYFFLFFNLDII